MQLEAEILQVNRNRAIFRSLGFRATNHILTCISIHRLVLDRCMSSGGPSNIWSTIHFNYFDDEICNEVDENEDAGASCVRDVLTFG